MHMDLGQLRPGDLIFCQRQNDQGADFYQLIIYGGAHNYPATPHYGFTMTAQGFVRIEDLSYLASNIEKNSHFSVYRWPNAETAKEAINNLFVYSRRAPIPHDPNRETGTAEGRIAAIAAYKTIGTTGLYNGAQRLEKHRQYFPNAANLDQQKGCYLHGFSTYDLYMIALQLAHLPKDKSQPCDPNAILPEALQVNVKTLSLLGFLKYLSEASEELDWQQVSTTRAAI